MNHHILLSVLLATTLAACGKSEPAKPAAAPAPASAPAAAQAPAPAPAAAPAPVAAAAAPAAPVAAPTTVAAANIDGAAVYKKSCGLCHATGVAGAPKYGDKAQWGARIAQGNDVLYTHAIKGFKGKAGVMPAKGGSTSLSDDQVKAAVDYMIAAAR
jgi:cytochrome c5